MQCELSAAKKPEYARDGQFGMWEDKQWSLYLDTRERWEWKAATQTIGIHSFFTEAEYFLLYLLDRFFQTHWRVTYSHCTFPHTDRPQKRAGLMNPLQVGLRCSIMNYLLQCTHQVDTARLGGEETELAGRNRMVCSKWKQSLTLWQRGPSVSRPRVTCF